MSICDGLVVLELGVGRASAVAGMMLADNGARVLKLEQPQGDRLRSELPSAFLVWNRGKESVVLDLHESDGRAEAQRLAAVADVVIEGFEKGVAESFGVDYDSLCAHNPRLIHCSIKGFPAHSAYGALKGYDGIVAAKAGYYLKSTVRDGPAFSNFAEGSFGAAQFAVQGILAALIVRDRTGRGQRVESSLYQGLYPYDLLDMINWHVVNRRPDLGIAPGENNTNDSLMSESLVTKDGRWIAFMSILPHQFKAYIHALGMDHLWDEPGFERAPYVEHEDRERFRDMLFARFRERTFEEWMPVLAAEPDLVCEPFSTIEGAMDHVQVAHNGAALEIEDERFGLVKQAAFPAAFSETPARVTRSAPALGEHAELPVAGASSEGTGAPAPLHALDGVTIVELANFYASPYALTLLAALGARVVKVEDLGGDPWRAMLGGLGGVQTVEGKESLALNLRDPAGREILHRLVRKADAFVFGFRPGSERSLEVDYETLEEINPRLVYLYGGGYGSDGPYARRAMYGNTTKAMMGGAYRQAGRWLRPERALAANVAELKQMAERFGPLGSVGGDPESASIRASALLMALLEQRRSGRGQFIDTSMVNLNAFANCEDFTRYAGKSELPLPDDDGYGLSALYRLYPTAQGWVFLAAPTQAEWEQLAGAIAPELIDSPRFASVSDRAENDAELATALGELLARKPAAEWEASLAPRGIGCVEVFERSFGDFSCGDAAIADAGLVAEVEHPRFGSYLRHAEAVRLSDVQPKLGGACEVGQHTEAILAELGYSPSEIAGLLDANVAAQWQS